MLTDGTSRAKLTHDNAKDRADEIIQTARSSAQQIMEDAASEQRDVLEAAAELGRKSRAEAKQAADSILEHA